MPLISHSTTVVSTSRRAQPRQPHIAPIGERRREKARNAEVRIATECTRRRCCPGRRPETRILIRSGLIERFDSEEIEVRRTVSLPRARRARTGVRDRDSERAEHRRHDERESSLAARHLVNQSRAAGEERLQAPSAGTRRCTNFLLRQRAVKSPGGLPRPAPLSSQGSDTSRLHGSIAHVDRLDASHRAGDGSRRARIVVVVLEPG